MPNNLSFSIRDDSPMELPFSIAYCEYYLEIFMQ